MGVLNMDIAEKPTASKCCQNRKEIENPLAKLLHLYSLSIGPIISYVTILPCRGEACLANLLPRFDRSWRSPA